ncbi:MAG: S9 family peptidase [Sphingomonadaceae bacterium]|nr:S9 family peptidase [Sphingomonadaceae bacterium]
MKKALYCGLAMSLAATSTFLMARPFTPEDLVQLRRLGGSTVSPDGSTLVYSLRETDLENDSAQSDLWRLDLTMPDAVPERLIDTPEYSESAPVISGDGARVFYLSDVSGSSQVWSILLSGGAPRQITSVEADIAGFSVGPGGGRIAVWFDEDADCAATSCPDAEAEPNAGSARAYDEIFVRHWSSWSDGTHSRLATFDMRDGAASGEGVVVSRPLDGDTPTRPFGGGEEIAWHPDGQSLFFVLREAGPEEPTSTDLDIYRVAADGATPPEILTADNPALDTLPTPSPGGRFLAYVAMATPGYEADRQVLHLRDLITGESRALSRQWDRSIQSIAWSRDLQYLWLVAGDTLDTALFRYSLADGVIERFSGGGHIGAVSPQPDGSVLVVHDSALAPADIFRIDAERQIAQITNLNADLLEGIDMPTSERFSFRGADGDTVHGMIYRPPGVAEGERVPVTLFVHGGPQGSFGDSWSYRWNPALMAAHGYAAVTIDFHGSTGYGQEFTDSINNDWGGKPLEDLQLGLAAVLDDNDWMDGERVCALGASYGGYMMNWIAGRWPERFDCLVNHAGIFDLRPFYYGTEELWFPEHDFGGPNYLREEAYERWNPVHHVENWQTPMLVIHGEKDFRIPYSQSLSAFTALQRQNVPSRLLVFPDENHWVLSTRNSLQWHREVYGWIDRWIGNEAGDAE